MKLSEELLRLAPDFGILKEEMTDIEKDVSDKLDRSVKIDEVDTITFGLETDDGKIVKVYVKADQAEEFEKALAEKLGEVDDIEEVLNALSKDYEIIDVVWPDEKDDTEEEDTTEDGSDSLDPQVYKNSKLKEPIKAKSDTTESLTYGEQVTMNILDEDTTTSIESRMSTPTQLMIYQAIVELGIPEIALARSPYRTQILKGIRDKATELSKSAAAKSALKVFIGKIHNDTDSENPKDKDDSKDKKKAETKKSSGHSFSAMKEDFDLDEAVTVASSPETRAVAFWESFEKLLAYLDPTGRSAGLLKTSTRLKQLRARSAAALSGSYVSQIKVRVDDMLKAAAGHDEKSSSVNESITADELTDLMRDLLMLADSSKGQSVEKVIDSQQYRGFLASIKTHLPQKFSGVVRTKLNNLKKALTKSSKFTPATVRESLTEEKCNWSVEEDGDSMVISCDQGLKMLLDDEQQEKLIKGLSNKDATVVKDADDESKKYVFSPRGLSVLVKQVGTEGTFMMDGADVDKILSSTTIKTV